MEEDRLRIPSTKRICFVGRTMNKDVIIEDFLLSMNEKKSTFIPRSNENLLFSKDFILNLTFYPFSRPAVDQVRNCTRVDKNVLNEIMKIVMNELLNLVNFLFDNYLRKIFKKMFLG